MFNEIEKRASELKNKILLSSDNLKIEGKVYYVSDGGNDESDGLTPTTAWKTLGKVSSANLCAGDGVLFRRGDIFRGTVNTQAGVTYGAFGEGDKPKLYGWDYDLASKDLWTKVSDSPAIYKMTKKILDVGTLVFNEGEKHSIKLIPSYIRGKFVCRNDESKEFDMRKEMVRNLDIYWHFDEILTTEPSRGETFPIPSMTDESYGTLYLRCDEGNPGEVFRSIEGTPRRHMFRVGDNANVRIDNLCIKYVGKHGVAGEGESVKGLTVTNCEIGWIGGTIQHYLGTDPNYPQGGRGTVTRFGNGIEIYGGCDGYEVSNCYVYQAYDAGITHQITTFGQKRVLKNVVYRNNLVEKCVYGIEYFLEMNEGDKQSYMENIEMSGNILRESGYGWGQQRHNVDTPALIKGWSYTNKARNYVIKDNIFDRCAYRLLHLVAEEESSLPEMSGNVYAQHLGGKIGSFGANAVAEPENAVFDERAEEKIVNVLGDKTAKVITL